jgi:hypothetical protein
MSIPQQKQTATDGWIVYRGISRETRTAKGKHEDNEERLVTKMEMYIARTGTKKIWWNEEEVD